MTWTHRRIALVAAAIAVAAAAAFGVWFVVSLATYAPLAFGHVDGPLTPASAGVLAEPVLGSGGKEVVFIRWRPRNTFTLELTVANTGARAVTLLGTPPPSLDAGSQFFQIIQMRLGGSDLSGPVRPLHRVDAAHPAVLAGHNERWLFVTLRLRARCIGGQPKGFWRTRDLFSGRGTTAEGGFDHIPLRYRIAGLFTKTWQLPLPQNLVLVCRAGIDPTIWFPAG